MFYGILNTSRIYLNANSLGVRHFHKFSNISKSVNVYYSTCKNIVSLHKTSKTRYLFNNFRGRSIHNSSKNPENSKHKSTVYYFSALTIFTVGMSYAAVPLYRIFCQSYSVGGVISTEGGVINISAMKKNENREITVTFNSDVSSSMSWNFHPQQSAIKVTPGETALAFYTAENPTDKPVIGVSTYNVVPFEAGQYFNKIQCFCFEEQMLNPHEQVDMPVFFYIDPEFADDPKMETVDNIVLSYTFFEVREGMQLPTPSFFNPHKR